jgi:hypothetical protein
VKGGEAKQSKEREKKNEGRTLSLYGRLLLRHRELLEVFWLLRPERIEGSEKVVEYERGGLRGRNDARYKGREVVRIGCRLVQRSRVSASRGKQGYTVWREGGVDKQ